MVSVIENWATLLGRIADVRPSDLPRHLALDIEVDDVADYEGYPNLLRELVDTVTEVQLPWSDGNENRPLPGDTIRCRARRGTPTRVFVHRDDYELIRPESPNPEERSRLGAGNDAPSQPRAPQHDNGTHRHGDTRNSVV